MSNQKVKEKMSLSASVRAEVYYKVKDICMETGTNTSAWLSNLIDNAIMEYRFRAFENESIAKEESKKSGKRALPEATDRQIEYIKVLCEQTDEPFLEDNLSVSEANTLIQELQHKRDLKWGRI